MSTSLSVVANRGLLLPVYGVTADTISSASSITQAGPLAGVPVAQQVTEATLQTAGTQAANTRMIIKCQDSGMPITDGGMRYLWRYNTDASDAWRGDGMATWKGVSQFEALDYTTTANRWRFPDVMTLQNDTLVCVAIRGQQDVVVWYKAKDGTSWSSVVLYSFASTSAELTACVTQLPSGRVLAFYGDCTNIISSYSDDNGATWTVSTHVTGTDVGTSLPTHPTTHTTKRMRVAYAAGSLCLMLHVLDGDAAQNRDRLYQYASQTLGSTWDYVAVTTGYQAAYAAATDADQNSRGWPELVVLNDKVVVFYVKAQNTTAMGAVGAYKRVIGSPYQSMQGVSEQPVWIGSSVALGTVNATGYIGDSDLAVSLDQTGELLFLARNFSANQSLRMAISTLGVNVSTSDVAWSDVANFHDSAKAIKGFALTHQMGRAVMLHGFKSDTDNHDDSLLATYIGGYTSLMVHPTVGNACIYMPFFEPDAVAADWTKTTTATPTMALSGAELNITLNSLGEQVTWTNAVSDAATKVYIHGHATSSGATSGAFIRARYASGATSYSVKVLFSDQSVVISDDNGGNLYTGGAAIKAAANTGIQLLLVVTSAGTARVWWRAADLSVKSDADQLWTDLGTFSGLTNGGASTQVAQFGASSSAIALHNVSAYIKTVAVTGYSTTLFNSSNPTSLPGRLLTSDLQYVDLGLDLRANAGPAMYGDLWYIDTRYTYGVVNVHSEVSPSPRTVWRTTGTTAQDLRWDLPEAEAYYEPSRVFSIALCGINWRTAVLYGWTGAAWTKIVDIDSAYGQNGLKFTRTGTALTGVYGGLLGSDSDHYYTFGTLAGSHVRITDSSGPTTVTRTIRANTEGGIGKATKFQTVMQLDDAQSTDPTGAGATDSMDILSRNVLVVCNSIQNQYTKFRLQIPSQDTAEGYFETGSIIIGTLAVFGQQYSRGRAVEAQQNTIVTTAINGTRRSLNKGPERRAVEFAWVDGVNTIQLFASTIDPDYIQYGAPTAARADAAYKVAGIVRELRGADTPVCYVPYLPQFTAFLGAQFTQTNMDQWFMGRVMSDVRIESIVGNENAGELVQVATVTIEEEV